MVFATRAMWFHKVQHATVRLFALARLSRNECESQKVQLCECDLPYIPHALDGTSHLGNRPKVTSKYVIELQTFPYNTSLPLPTGYRP